MKKIFFILTVFLWISSNAQTEANDSASTVVIHKDPRIDLLINKQVEINDASIKKASNSNKGYRLLVINTNDRNEAVAARTKVYTYFPELKPYTAYQSPYFKVKVGNFKERKEAEEYRRKLNPYFPKGVFVINDIIEIKAEKEEPNSN